MDVFASFPDIEQPLPASEFLHEYLSNFSKGTFKPSLEQCSATLSLDSGMYEQLKIAHQARDLGALESLCAYFERNAWRTDPRLKNHARRQRSSGFHSEAAKKFLLSYFTNWAVFSMTLSCGRGWTQSSLQIITRFLSTRLVLEKLDCFSKVFAFTGDFISPVPSIPLTLELATSQPISLI
ncbi:hypothetical protein LENED_010705 [Lentinula edodes]|uniref:Uncharacterized protein n=1 Tax=Lentinula edodes TaxID=5353 RepID=A0A1Q3ENF2_LENED|nr:hypothetical protein LENED_010705 [Lentinula edodes]